jgi:hypothetical protein
VPVPWAAQDIGPVGVAGSESCTNNVFTVTASGSDYDASYTYTVNAFDTFRCHRAVENRPEVSDSKPATLK